MSAETITRRQAEPMWAWPSSPDGTVPRHRGRLTWRTSQGPARHRKGQPARHAAPKSYRRPTGRNLRADNPRPLV